MSEDAIVRELQIANKWLRVLAVPALRAALVDELTKPELARIYEESDGRDIRHVASSAGVGFGTVQRYWQDWSSKGLMESADRKGRFRKIIDLRDVGLERLVNKQSKGDSNGRNR